MSAFDITGAIVWGLLAVVFLWAWVKAPSGHPGEGGVLILGVVFTAAFIFCLARLFGASL